MDMNGMKKVPLYSGLAHCARVTKQRLQLSMLEKRQQVKKVKVHEMIYFLHLCTHRGVFCTEKVKYYNLTVEVEQIKQLQKFII